MIPIIKKQVVIDYGWSIPDRLLKSEGDFSIIKWQFIIFLSKLDGFFSLYSPWKLQHKYSNPILIEMKYLALCKL